MDRFRDEQLLKLREQTPQARGWTVLIEDIFLSSNADPAGAGMDRRQ